MNQKADNAVFPIKSMINGSFTVVLMTLLVTVVLGILTEIGWTGTLQWGGSLYLVIVYLSVVVGSIFAGLNSGEQGWITGIGVGVIGSVLIYILAMIAGEKVDYPIFLLKILINSFIGAFGGIIGVNLSKTE